MTNKGMAGETVVWLQGSSATTPASSTLAQAFLAATERLKAPKPPPAPKLIFALDATASREPAWEMAIRLHDALFDVAAGGGLQVQLVYYSGLEEFRASPFYSHAAPLAAVMRAVRCKSGLTQIEKVLAHAARQNPAALVFIGDAMEEPASVLYEQARKLSCPAFLFHEGDDALARITFTEIARLSGGACLPFDTDAPAKLADLLSSVAAYAAGGRQALQSRDTAGSRLLLSNLSKQGE